MKKIKQLITILIFTVFFAVFAFPTAAENTAFTVYDKDGNVTELSGNTEAELMASIPELSDGDTIVLNKNFRITSQINFISSEDSPRNINFDLNGHRLYTLEKRNMIVVGGYTTLNVYSSKAGGEIASANKSNANLGSNIFCIFGKSAKINVGSFNDGDAFYPGSNLSTYSSCLIDLLVDIEDADENSQINIDGGTYYSIVDDYSGFIIPRCGEAVINIKNADIISFGTRYIINSTGNGTTLNMENCNILQYQNKYGKLFNALYGDVNFKNCLSTFDVFAAEKDGLNPAHLNLVGNNIFSHSEKFDFELIKNIEGMKLVNTYSDYELNSKSQILSYYDNTGDFKKRQIQIPVLSEAYMFVNDSEKVIDYKFIDGETEILQTWLATQTPKMPYELEYEGEEGRYKYIWKKTFENDESIVYTVEKNADFKIKVRGVCSGEYLNFKIYIPSWLIDESLLDFNKSKIQGVLRLIYEWKKVEIDGESYYYTNGTYLEKESANEDIEILIHCNFGEDTHVETTWSFTVSEYVEKVLSTEEDGVYTREEYQAVHNIKNNFLSSLT